MKKCSCLAVYFLFLSCAISFSLGDMKCDKSESALKYRCSSSDGSLSARKLRDLVSPAAVELDLSRNELALSSGCFNTFKKLQTLNLSHGSLSRITGDILSGLISLKTLDLSNNQFENLPPDVFDDLKNLAEVRLQNNKLDCHCDTGLLPLLTLKQNVSLGPVPAMCYKPDTFKKLKTLINQHCEVNECLEENDCDDMATCKDQPYTYTCKCSTRGFEGNGKECTDINECAGKNDCSKVGGQCINTHGSYKCSCKKGFTGNGKTCVDIDECKSHDCDQGECSNTLGSFSCECHEGYAVNDKYACVDIDECQSSNNSCDAIANSYCVNEEKFLPTDDGYICLCKTGYREVGKSCVPEGNIQGLIKSVAMIGGGFLGILFLIIVSSVLFRKWQNRTPKQETTEETPVVMAPVVGMDPIVDFGYLGRPQDEEGAQYEEEWGEIDEYEEDTE